MTMIKSLLSYFSRLKTVLFGRKERRNEAAKRMAFERKRNGFRKFLRNGLRVEGLEPRALMAVDVNVTGVPMLINMTDAGDTAEVSRHPAFPASSSPVIFPASIIVETNTPDPDPSEPDDTLTFVRTAGTSSTDPTAGGIRVTGASGAQTLTVEGSMSLSNTRGTSRGLDNFIVTGVETINLKQDISVVTGGALSGNASTVSLEAPGSAADAVALVGTSGTINAAAGAYSDGEVTVSKEGLTVGVADGVSGFSLTLGTGINGITLTGAGDMDVTGNSGNNTIVGNEGVNSLTGGEGDDTLTGAGGSDSISGGLGVDTAIFSGNYEDYDVTINGTTITVLHTASGDSDTLTGVERLDFQGDNQTVLVVGSDLAYTTISSAVAAAEAGDVILIAAGTYEENLVIDKEVHLIGSGNGSDPSSATIIDPAAGNGITFGVNSDGASIESIRVTGAVNGIQISAPEGSNATGNLTFRNIASSGNTAFGLNFANALSATTGMVTIEDSEFSNNLGTGIWIPETGNFAGVSISGSTFSTNGSQGFGVMGATVGSVSITTSSFENNGTDAIAGHGDLILFSFSGNATLSDLTITGDGTGGNGLQITGPTNPTTGVEPGTRKAVNPIGTVNLSNVDISGSYGRDVFIIARYTNLTGLSITGLDITASHGGTPDSGWAQIAIDNVGGDVDLATYGLADAGLKSRISTSNGVVYPDSTSYTEGADLTGGSGSDILIGYILDDTLVGNDSPDYLNGALGNDSLEGGAGDDILDGSVGTDTAVFSGALSAYTFSYSGANLVVTGPDGTDSLTNIEKLQFTDKTVWVVGSPVGSNLTTISAAVTAASNGEAILVTPGTYTENVTVNKALTILGPFASVAGTNGSRSVAAGTGEANIVGLMKVSSTGSVTVSGLRFVYNASSGVGGASNPSLQRLNASSGGSHTYSNNIFYSNQAGGSNAVESRAISFETLSSGSTTVSGNYITGNGPNENKYDAARWNRGIWSDGGGSSSITLTSNTIEYSRTAINLDVGGSAAYEVTNNTFRDSGTGISFGANAASGVGNVSGNFVSNVDTDFNFQNIAGPVTLDLTRALSNTVPETETVLVYGGQAGDTITGGPTIDIVRPNSSFQLTPTVVNDSGDTVNLGLGNDILEIQDSRLVPGDSYDGGGGTDTVVFTSTTAGQDLVLPASTKNFENAWISTLAGATTGTTALSLDASAVSGGLGIKGNDGDNTLKGGSGGDTINGNAGNDTLKGNAGNDTLDGGDGTDTAEFSGNYSAYTIAFSGSNVTVSGPDGSDTVTKVEKLTFADRSVHIVNGAGSTITTISAAIAAANAGDVVLVAAGTYTENLVVNKTLTIKGVGSANDPAANTIISSAAGSTPVISISAGGVSASDRLVIDNVRVTGATGEINAGAGILVASSSPVSYLTFSNFVSTGNQGAGVAFNSTAAVADVEISDATISSNGNAGIRIATAVPSFTGLSVSDTTISSNSSSGFSYNPSGTISNVGTNFSFTDVTFTTNNTVGTANQHELSFFGFKGNATLTRVNVTGAIGTNGGLAHGIVFSGHSTYPALGTVTLTDVTVGGTFGKGALLFQQYSDISGVSLSRVNLSGATAPWGQFILETTDTDPLQLGDTTLKTLVLWNAGGVNATAATFKHITTGATLDRAVLADSYQIANQIADKVDLSTLGYVNFKSGNVYVTPSSYATPNVLASVQRAVSAASTGDTVWAQAGTYAEENVTASVNNLTVNVEAGVLGLLGVSLDASVTNGSLTLTGAGAVNLGGNDGNNTLTGNDGDNVITGGAGNDTIDGGAGSNKAVFSGTYDQYTITLGTPITVTGPDGTDTLTNIQFLKFADLDNVSVALVSTSVSISSPAVTYGSSGVITVTVSRDDSVTAPLPSGTVSLVVGTMTLDPVTLDDDGKAVFTVPGLDAGTYALTATYTASGLFEGSSDDTGSLVVNTKQLTVTGAAGTTRAYDGTTTVVVTGGELVGIVGSDDVSLVEDGSGSGEMVDANVGGNKSLTVTGYALEGAKAANYTIAQPTDAKVTISAKVLTITGSTAADRDYDGTKTVVVSGGSLEGIVGSDVVTLNAAGASGSISSKDVGDYSVTVTGYALGGAGASNYSLDQPTDVNVTISALELTITGAVAQNRDYNQLTSVEVSGGTLVGVIGDDEVAIDDSAAAGEMATKVQGIG
jgi:hypothetical protein